MRPAVEFVTVNVVTCQQIVVEKYLDYLREVAVAWKGQQNLFDMKGG